MAVAVTLLFDPVATASVREIWHRMAELGISSSMLDLHYPPHLTLIVVEDEGLAGQLDRALPDLAQDARLNLTLGPPGRFVDTDVVWLGVDGAGLRELQAKAATLVGDAAIAPHYRPDGWVPHVTLQTAGHADAALELAHTMWPAQQAAEVRTIELVGFSPIVTLKRLGV
ncbi:hypothetical protein ASG47_14175 [Devosia sp. Leaf420]|uniref:2'-5' RNA ligase family protein n=1 Tax=Devosia sp. Leaf420 TaxID=1736374 RepID=UPI0007139A8F|nr:2'-5' RNA ligase family protein [Devosia sp. Leaf420]KQT46077.1 hypothetical protein ASG47_14175 [Devosia sp. Leaf420]